MTKMQFVQDNQDSALFVSVGDSVVDCPIVSVRISHVWLKNKGISINQLESAVLDASFVLSYNERTDNNIVFENLKVTVG